MELIPCESNIANGSLSYAYDEFHGVAVLTLTHPKDYENETRHEQIVHVCFECAKKHFARYVCWQTGVRWP